MEPLMILSLIIGLALIALLVWLATRLAGYLTVRFLRSEPTAGIKPISVSCLKESMLNLNHETHPFTVQLSDETDLEVEWKVVDAKWLEILGPGWARKTYRAWLRFDDASKTVKYCERLTESGFHFGGPTATVENKSFTGLELWGRRGGYRWGIRDDFTIGEIYNYQFSPNDIKAVVRQIANDHGWAFELVMTKRHATYPKRQPAAVA